jgi:alpha-L-fucosidase
VKTTKILKCRAGIPFVPGTAGFMQILACLCASLVLSVSTASAYDVAPKMAWWYDARFGMFIHFGSYSYYGHGEWAFFNENWTKADYQTQISARFNPTNFDAATIVGCAKAAGMKYLVITAKHHEGLAMWHSQVPSFTDVPGTTQFNLHDYTACKRDLLMELKNECDAQGIKFCLYYSIMDWDHPSQTANHSTYYSTMSSLTARSNYINDMKAQLAELITNYNPAVLWFDGDWCANPGSPTLNNWWIQADALSLSNYIIGLKPDLILNERIKRDLDLGDFACPEQTVPAAALARPWETCATMNSAWGYTSNLENSYRSPSNILHEMVQVVSRDGNYLLNIGPKGDGSMTPGSTNILSAFATWMSTYGESVHGTTASPYETNEPSWGYYTKKPGKLYAHVFNWPVSGQLQVPVLSNAVNRVYLLNDANNSLSYTLSGGNINISVPASAPNAMDSVVVVAVSPPPLTVGQPVGQNQVNLLWPSWSAGYAVTGYAVYGATNLAPPVPWQVVTNVLQTSNGVFNLTLPAGEKQQFFKLGPP